MIGVVGVAYSLFSIYISLTILIKIGNPNGFAALSFLNYLLLAFDILIITQFILAIRKNKLLKDNLISSVDQ
jgi:hypothetical protein